MPNPLLGASAKVTSCFQGILVVNPATGALKDMGSMEANCTAPKTFGCFQRVEGNNTVYGCEDEESCSALKTFRFGDCCLTEDNCNNPNKTIKNVVSAGNVNSCDLCSVFFAFNLIAIMQLCNY
jgi:hypothetical protein